MLPSMRQEGVDREHGTLVLGSRRQLLLILLLLVVLLMQPVMLEARDRSGSRSQSGGRGWGRVAAR